MELIRTNYKTSHNYNKEKATDAINALRNKYYEMIGVKDDADLVNLMNNVTQSYFENHVVSLITLSSILIQSVL